MNFRVTARTILQLGAELISSDAIAFYELIKNSFDAGSPKAEVRIGIRVDQEVLESFLKEVKLKTFSKTRIPEILQELEKAIDYNAPHADELAKEIAKVSTKEELLHVLRHSNYIMIQDTGDGMSLKDLGTIYLTIGTRNRYEQKHSNANGTGRPILGEKGLGRLSVMRLGDIVNVETTKINETHFNILDIDWARFSHDSNDLIETIEIEPKKGKIKPNKSYKGTTIWIYDLQSKWTKEALSDVAREELSRFIDPFQKANRDFISLWFNNQFVALTSVEKDLIDNAQAIVRLDFKSGPGKKPILTGLIDYKFYNRQKSFVVEGTHLASITKGSIAILQSLGPFNAEMYWYNRQRITIKNGYKDHRRIKDLVEKWGGGVMVYRDGFRVNPYGGPNDDWLRLDPVALKSQGYKLNRKQFVGKLDISSAKNPRLTDQTSREGLRDCDEKSALVAILQHVIWNELKSFLDGVEQDIKEQAAVLSLDDIEERIEIGEKQAMKALDYLVENVPGMEEEEATVDIIRNVIADTKEMVMSAKASSESFKTRLNTTIHLAGLGLMVDIIGHELTRVTISAGKTLGKLAAPGSSKKSGELLSTLRYQLKTIETRLKVLDPLGPSGRQRKEDINVAKLITTTLEYHRDQFERHQIELTIEKDEGGKKWEMHVVPGMIIQITENLITNSIYWLKQEKLFGDLKHAQITVSINESNKTISFADNGPGIPKERAEDIFEPFYSTKPPGDGKGLGLYISREIAEYNDASLYLQKSNHPVWRTFVLDLSKL